MEDWTETRAQDGREAVRETADRSREIGDGFAETVQTFWDSLAQTGKEPIIRAIAHTNLELSRLMRRRAQAYAEFPVRLADCQLPHDVLNEHTRFFTDMVRDYQSSTERLFENWMNTAASGSLTGERRQ